MNFELVNENVKSPLFRQSWLSHQGNLHPLPKAFPACVDVSEQAAKCHHWTLSITVLMFQSHQAAKCHHWTLGIIVLMFQSQAAKCHHWTQTVPLPAGCKQTLSLLLHCTPSVVAVWQDLVWPSGLWGERVYFHDCKILALDKPTLHQDISLSPNLQILHHVLALGLPICWGNS